MTKEILLLTEILKQNGYSLTMPRKKVCTVLAEEHPINMMTLVGSLPDIDRSSIYRTVALFEKIGIVNRIQIGWKYKIELSETFNHHHHHITCKQCGKISDLPENKKIEKLLNQLTASSGYTPLSHQIEITGLCQQCRI